MPLLRLLVAILLIAFAAPTLAADRAIIILDGSGSMWAQIDGKPRIEIARQTLSKVLAGVPDTLELGFMSYGHREKGACDDIELLVEPAAGTAAAISAAADAIVPKGKTPISAAVKMAAETLKFTEDKATVILITDGLETCEADPCALASELEKEGVDFTTHVVGFGLTEDEGKQVACLAENTGGKYIAAGDEETLTAALKSTVAEVSAPAPEPAPEPAATKPEFNIMPEAVLAEGGEPLGEGSDLVWEVFKAQADGSLGDQVTTEYGYQWKGNLEPGDYIIRAGLDYAHIEMPVTITADDVAKPLFVMNAGHLVLRPLPSDGAEPDSNAAVYTAFPNGESTTSYGETKLFVPAGDTEVTVTIGSGVAELTVPVAAGESVDRDIVVGVGVAAVNAFYVAGTKVDDSNLFEEVFAAKKDLEGNRKSVANGYGADQIFNLPPGDYVLVSKVGGAVLETPFTVVSGERVEVNAILAAGVVAITAPGMDHIEVFGAKKSIEGNRTSFGYAFGGTMQTVLPAGDYVVVATSPDGATSKEGKASVVAGERLELTVE
jgi:Ca-activated chloride channel homolog